MLFGMALAWKTISYLEGIVFLNSQGADNNVNN